MFQPFRFLRPAPPAPPVPGPDVARLYPKFRWQILEATFIGYATYYLVRNNLPVVSKEMGEALAYSKDQIGNMLALTAISYGVGKFLMGAWSDRSNPRFFMPLGLLLTALCNFLFGSVASYPVHLLLWTLNGLVQGMGWGPCGRSLGHWFSVRERGAIFAVWNIAHNVGGGLTGIVAAHSAHRLGWQYAFYVPGILAVLCAAYLLMRLRDTPQSVGLPPVEVYRGETPEPDEARERELSTRELLLGQVLNNRVLWLFASANFFVYIARYSLLDWGPTYLKEVKGASLTQGGLSTAVFEFAGIFSTLLMGWLSDRTGGRRGMVSLLCMAPVLLALGGILLTPPGHLWVDMALFAVIGFFVYPPVMLLGVAGLDFTSKKAVGTAAGFIGLFGYFGRTVQGKGLGWIAQHHGWTPALLAVLVCTLLSILLLAATWRLQPKDWKQGQDAGAAQPPA